MDFGDAVANGFRNYAGFDGRARRSEYWWWVLFTVLVGLGTATLDLFSGVPVFNALTSLALFLPSVAIGVRRLHDTDRSGWWWLIIFVPIVGFILLLVWFCTDGARGANRYGADPKLRSADPFAPAPGPIPAPSAPTPMSPAAPMTPALDVLSRLEQLGRLRDQGVLTQAEFEAEKAKILGGGAA